MKNALNVQSKDYENNERFYFSLFKPLSDKFQDKSLSTAWNSKTFSFDLMNFLLYRHLQSQSEEKLFKWIFTVPQRKILVNVFGKEELLNSNIIKSLCKSYYSTYSENVANDLNTPEFPVSLDALEETLKNDYPVFISKGAKEIMLKAFDFPKEGGTGDLMNLLILSSMM